MRAGIDGVIISPVALPRGGCAGYDTAVRRAVGRDSRLTLRGRLHDSLPRPATNPRRRRGWMAGRLADQDAAAAAVLRLLGLQRRVRQRGVAEDLERCAGERVTSTRTGIRMTGLDDWLQDLGSLSDADDLWIMPGGTGNIAVTIRGEMALITDSHVPRFWNWVGSARPPFITDKPYCRATFVCLRETPGWRAIHVHFSMGRGGARPDQGGPE